MLIRTFTILVETGNVIFYAFAWSLYSLGTFSATLYGHLSVALLVYFGINNTTVSESDVQQIFNT